MTSISRMTARVLTLATGLLTVAVVQAQTPLERFENGIRQQTAPTETAAGPALDSSRPIAEMAQAPTRATIPAGRAFLGANVDDSHDRGNGARIVSVRLGGPAAAAGLHVQDLVVGAAGTRVRQTSDLSSVIGLLSPGDKLALEILRDNKPMHIDIQLGAAPGAIGPGNPAATGATTANVPPRLPMGGAPGAGVPGAGLSGGQAETLPAPPPLEGPALSPTPGAGQTLTPTDANRIDYLQRRVDQLERRVEELEKALSAMQRR